MKSAKNETLFDLIVIIRVSRNGLPTVTHALRLVPILQPFKPRLSKLP